MGNYQLNLQLHSSFWRIALLATPRYLAVQPANVLYSDATTAVSLADWLCVIQMSIREFQSDENLPHMHLILC